MAVGAGSTGDGNGQTGTARASVVANVRLNRLGDRLRPRVCHVRVQPARAAAERAVSGMRVVGLLVARDGRTRMARRMVGEEAPGGMRAHPGRTGPVGYRAVRRA